MGVSLAWLGHEVGVSGQQIRKYERGDNRIGFSMLVRICHVLGCRAADLVHELEPMDGKGTSGERK